MPRPPCICVGGRAPPQGADAEIDRHSTPAQLAHLLLEATNPELLAVRGSRRSRSPRRRRWSPLGTTQSPQRLRAIAALSRTSPLRRVLMPDQCANSATATGEPARQQRPGRILHRVPPALDDAAADSVLGIAIFSTSPRARPAARACGALTPASDTSTPNDEHTGRGEQIRQSAHRGPAATAHPTSASTTIAETTTTTSPQEPA